MHANIWRWVGQMAFILILAAILSTVGAAQVQPAPVPASPFEVAASGVRAVTSPEERAHLVEIMDRARSFDTLPAAGFPFHLKLSFMVSSGGETQHDGAWQMEEIYAPKLGILLTAETSGYSLQQLRVSKMIYQSPQGAIPLRAHEAIGHLLGPIENAMKTEQDLIRTVQASVNGMAVTCVLLTNAQRSAQADSPGRLWQEREECIDPQTGHLVLHSPVPGLVILYDFTQSLHFHGKELPGKMTVMENGVTVISEQVESLADMPSVNPNTFTPSASMQPQGTMISGRLTDTLGIGPPSSSPLQSVVVFGLLNPDGSISEAHPLQSSDATFARAAFAIVNELHLRVPLAPAPIPNNTNTLQLCVSVREIDTRAGATIGPSLLRD